MKTSSRKLLTAILTACLLILVGNTHVQAACTSGAQTCSNSYQVNEAFFGAGGALNNCSAHYCSKQAAGETAVGNTKSANFQAQGGFNTDRTPFIQFTINNTSIDVGTLTASNTSTATASFTIEAYLSHGFVVQNVSPPPTNGSYQLAAITGSPAPSAAGTEQFGMNLVANTSPSSLSGTSADPSYIPDSTFSFGQVASKYATPNQYMYAYSGADSEVAYSSSSSSYTTYTISYIFNVSHITPGGTYTFNHVMVATASY
ncbi:MAG TPA: hypothetical protein VHB51_01950 [Candidatus Saccharimonadales bacterium]|nr:hypothetical protein [Candidatus Saccharimonadales bacterium]